MTRTGGPRQMRAILCVAAFAGSLLLVACGSSGSATESGGHKPQGRSRPLRSCPTGKSGSVVTEDARTATELVPPGAVSALVCRYLRSDVVVRGKTAQGHLDEHRVSDPRTVETISRLLASLPKPPNGEYTCTEAGYSLWYLVAFTYARGAPVFVEIRDVGSNCAYVQDAGGNLIFVPTSPFLEKLDSLLPRQRPAKVFG
jgi:hypothetical protein